MKDSERKVLIDEWMEHAEHLHGGENAGTARALYEEIIALRKVRPEPAVEPEMEPMNKVKRYNIHPVVPGLDVEHPNGDYVRIGDYNALLRRLGERVSCDYLRSLGGECERDALQAERDLLREEVGLLRTLADEVEKQQAAYKVARTVEDVHFAELGVDEAKLAYDAWQRKYGRETDHE
jgi:hypothetical protein